MTGIGSPDDVAGCINSASCNPAAATTVHLTVAGGGEAVIEISSDEEDDVKKVDLIASSSKVTIEISSSDEENDGSASSVKAMTADDKRRDDDECCILHSDPFAEELEKKLTISRHSYVREQDIIVVAERGEVACRDFPHSRHLCTEHPFSRSDHESCCSLCYCYVCDVAAPCKYWKGELASGHCNASDQEFKWRDKRIAQRLSAASDQH